MTEANSEDTLELRGSEIVSVLAALNCLATEGRDANECERYERLHSELVARVKFGDGKFRRDKR